MKLQNKEEIKGKKVLILGLARTGVAAARLCNSLGAKVLVSDIKSEEELKDYTGMLEGADVEFFFGSHPESLLEAVDLIIVSPGIQGSIPVLVKARSLGIEIISEIELAYNFLKSPVIAITGTNGKTTTTKLIQEILAAGGYKTASAGNIGNPLSGLALDSFLYDYLVVEVSSFQLEEIIKFKPFISLILNVTPDHLDRYRNIGEYAKAKFRIFENQGEGDFLILNYDDPMLRELPPQKGISFLYFSTKDAVVNGSYIEGDQIISRFGSKAKTVCPVSEVKLEGLHNLENVLAAITACSICEVTPDKIREALKKFKPPHHRMEFVRELNGVRFVDDSKGTNVGAVIKSLMSYSSPVILIAGGRDKNGDFSSLRDLVKSKVKSLVLIGEAGEKIRKSLDDVTRTIDASSMEDAVRKSYAAASEGDVVLLSPGCASFDMFSSYEERGQVFKKAVKDLNN